MTTQGFIAKYEGWFSYTRREELKKEMEADLGSLFIALHQPPVVGRSEQCDHDYSDGTGTGWNVCKKCGDMY